MVSVGKLKAAQAKYYLDQAESHQSPADAIASGAEDYYVSGTEAAGRWHGRGAIALGLADTVEAEALHRVLAGQHPRTGSELRRSGSVAGFDVTFSAPKSASLLFGVGDEAMQGTIREAHERAVVSAFGYFEDAVSVARRGAGGLRKIEGGGLTAASFLHRTSRAGDPQLHTHVVVANLIQGLDGRWSALDGRLVYAHARTAGYLYQAALRAELTRRLGVRWRPVQKGLAEIDGMPEKVLRAFSRRRAEIEEAMARHGAAGFEAAQVAALSTRRRKDRNIRPEELTFEWRERAIAHGLHEWRIDRMCGRGRVPEQPDWQELFASMAGPKGLTRDRSTFGRRDVIQALSSAATGGATVESIRFAADAFLASPNAVPLLGSRDRDVEQEYSTPNCSPSKAGSWRLRGAFEHPAVASPRPPWSRPRLSGDPSRGRATQHGAPAH